jgi:ABC-type uncharacterized transport system auxiliary subunit
MGRHPVGIVTSGDLILKQDPAVRGSGPPPGAHAHVEQVKAVATTAGKLMTSPAIVVRRHHTVAQAADRRWSADATRGGPGSTSGGR